MSRRDRLAMSGCYAIIAALFVLMAWPEAWT